MRRTPGSWVRECHHDRSGLLPFADWLEDQGEDRRALAVRWLASTGRWPTPRTERTDYWSGGWLWWIGASYTDDRPSLIPANLWHALALMYKANTRSRHTLAYVTPEAAVLDLLRVWTPEMIEGAP